VITAEPEDDGAAVAQLVAATARRTTAVPRRQLARLTEVDPVPAVLGVSPRHRHHPLRDYVPLTAIEFPLSTHDQPQRLKNATSGPCCTCGGLPVRGAGRDCATHDPLWEVEHRPMALEDPASLVVSGRPVDDRRTRLSGGYDGLEQVVERAE